MCAEQSSVELAGANVKFQVLPTKTDFAFESLVVANLTMLRVTNASEHQASKETGRNAKPEMASVNGIELRQQF